MAEADDVRRETAKELQVEEAELDYIEEVLVETAKPEEAESYDETSDIDGEPRNSFHCRRPAYQGDYLYYYRDCNGPYGRLRRDRIFRIARSGQCGPLARYIVIWA